MAAVQNLYFDLRTLFRYLVEYCIKNLDKPSKNKRDEEKSVSALKTMFLSLDTNKVCHEDMPA